MAEVDKRLQSSWQFYRCRSMTEEEKRAALMLEPVSAPLGLTEWRTTKGEVYAKGANAVSAQVGINASGMSASDRQTFPGTPASGAFTDSASGSPSSYRARPDEKQAACLDQMNNKEPS